MLNNKKIWHGIKPTHDWINSTLQSHPLAILWQNPKTDSRLNLWVGNSCQNSLTSNSRNCEALEPYEQVFPENNCKASIINSIKSYTTSTKSSGLSQS